MYREPFLGGGALFFYLMGTSAPPKRAYLSDALGDLVLTYQVVKDAPEDLLARLDDLKRAHSNAHYYAVREAFNAGGGDPTERAAWLIYLNKTCYNGLFRTNRSGLFNVPVGRFVRPRIVDRARLMAASEALGSAKLSRQSFEQIERTAKPGDVVYFDPPYVPVSKTASFDAYSLGAFGPEAQERLARTFRRLDAKGCLLVLSNSDTEEVRRLYKGYELTTIVAPRSISARGSTRGPVTELVVRNAKRFPHPSGR